MSEFIGFFGDFKHKINKAGRISVPSDFRSSLNEYFSGQKLYLMAEKNHVRVYPAETWKKAYQSMMAKADENPKFKLHLRKVFSRVRECKVDDNGRIMVPPAVRELAGFDEECLINGFGEHFEIWSLDKWNAEYSDEHYDESDEFYGIY